MKYQPFESVTLTYGPERVEGQCMVGSLTGAVCSQRVTEECNDTLSAVGHRAQSAMA